MRTQQHTRPGELQQDDTLVSSNRQLSAPADLERSRRRASTPRYCQWCGGPWIRELRGGPVVSHELDCEAVPGTPRCSAPDTQCCGGIFPTGCIFTP